MIQDDFRENLCALGYEDTVLFIDDAFDKSVIGIDADGRAVYDFNKMVEEYMEDNDCSYEDAVEWIEYNTLRALPYAGPRGPIVVTIMREQIDEV